MTNLEYIKSLPPEKLAHYLIYCCTELEPDDGYYNDDAYSDCPTEIEYWCAPDCSEFWTEEEAVEYTINWLNSKILDR